MRRRSRGGTVAVGTQIESPGKGGPGIEAALELPVQLGLGVEVPGAARRGSVMPDVTARRAGDREWLITSIHDVHETSKPARARERFPPSTPCSRQNAKFSAPRSGFIPDGALRSTRRLPDWPLL